jgi:hypothetical protein
MDGDTFDRVTRSLARGETRRRFLRSIAGGLGGVAALFGRSSGEAAPSSCSIGCAGLPGPQKAACKQACKKCGGDFDRVCVAFGPFGPTGFACCQAGTACDFETGQCVEVATCPSGEPAENCSLGVETDCADGACAQVISVDGGCACVERQCSFEPCTTGADCASGLCVDIPGCCGDPTPFCGIPCGSATTNRNTNGWGP